MHTAYNEFTKSVKDSPADGPSKDIDFIATWWNASRGRQDARSMGRVHLSFGEELRFGISSRSDSFEPQAAPSIGAFKVVDNAWSLSNFTSSTTFAVENLEGGAELVKILPRRLGVVIPFEMSRVLIPSRTGLVEVTVFGKPPEVMHDSEEADPCGSAPFQLDETSKYFLVLVALCEPRLRGSSMAAVPSVLEVVDRLKSSDLFRDANRSSVNYHIDYLRKRKVQIEQWAMYSAEGRMHSKREALVSFALRYDLVREEHLDLLPPRAKARL